MVDEGVLEHAGVHQAPAKSFLGGLWADDDGDEVPADAVPLYQLADQEADRG